MKSMIQCIAVVCVFASVSSGGWDYEVAEGYQGSFTLTGEQKLLMTGGGTPDIIAKNFSYVEIWGSDSLDEFPGGITGIHLQDSSYLYYLGGETSLLDMREEGTAILQGGIITTIRSYQYILQPDQEVLRHIEIVCDTHEFDDSTNYLSGTWMDGSSFGIQLVDQDDYDRVINNIFFTPEPVSIALFGIGVLFVRRRKRA